MEERMKIVKIVIPRWGDDVLSIDRYGCLWFCTEQYIKKFANHQRKYTKSAGFPNKYLKVLSSEKVQDEIRGFIR
jgi:hypothetical protein